MHPNAAKQMRDTIYELANATNNQIYMIDLSKRALQVLDSISKESYDLEIEGRVVPIENEML